LSKGLEVFVKIVCVEIEEFFTFEKFVGKLLISTEGEEVVVCVELF